MIDQKLNYGRRCIEEFAYKAGEAGTILDVGAGIGEDLLICKKAHPQAKLLGIEVRQSNVEKLIESGITIASINIESDIFPYPDESIDIIVANQILEHTKEVFWILHEITRTLKTGGTLILGVPNLASLHNRLLLLFGRHPTCIRIFSAHVRGFTKTGMLRFTEDCYPGGYELVAFRGSNFYPLPPFLAKFMANALPGMAVGIFFMFRKKKVYNDEFVNKAAVEHFETNFFLGPSTRHLAHRIL